MKKTQKTTRRNLPHILNAGATYFITSNLHGALPKKVLIELMQEYQQKVDVLKVTRPKNFKRKKAVLDRQYFKKYDEYLDQVITGPTYLAQPKIAEILQNQFHRYDGEYYDLLAFTIMSNHFHLLIDTSIQINSFEANPVFIPDDYIDLSKIMNRLKGVSARYCNLALKRKGIFWIQEYYDRIVRNDREKQHYLHYILQNPVKAGLTQNWKEFPYSYLKKGLWIKDELIY